MNKTYTHKKKALLSLIMMIALLSSCFALIHGFAAEAFTVTLNAGKGSFNENGQQVKTIERTYSTSREILYNADAETIYYTGIPKAPDSSELLFTKWCTSPDLSEASELPEGYRIDKDITLYAKYDDVYTVTIDAQGKNLDAMAPTPTKDFKVKKGESLDISFSVYNCGSQVPYGVFNNSNGQGESIVDHYVCELYEPYTFTIKNYKPNSSQTLYVCFCDPITVSFDANGGIFDGGETVFEQKRGHGIKVQQRVRMGSSPNYLSREGYTLVGWSNNPNAKEGIAADDLIANANETVYAIWDHTHVEKTIPAVEPTCTSEGKTEGKICSVCGKILVEQNTLEKRSHEISTEGTKPATCTEPGKKGKVSCHICGEIFEPEEEIPALGHDYKNGVCTRCGAEDPDYVKPLPDGLNLIDGEWVYIRNNEVATDFNGLAKHEKDYWYIEKGKANFGYTGLVNSSSIEGYKDIQWYWVTKGVFDKTYNGAEPYLDRGTFLVENGYIDFHKTTVYYNEKTDKWMVFVDGMFSKNANGIYQNKYGWWKATNGIVNFKETGVFQNNFGWWRVKDSKVDFNAQGIYQNSFGWWKTTNGKVTFKEDGVFQNEYGWWKVKGSKVDFGFTGIASNKYGSWYIEKGKVNFNKKGKVKYDGKTYTIKGGKVQ